MSNNRTDDTASKTPRLWFPPASTRRRPSHWWYWGRAVYVSRRDYLKIFLVFMAAGVPLGAAGVLGGWKAPLAAALTLAALGLVLLMYSLLGLYRMYGHPSMRYYRRLLQQGNVRDGAQVADLHIGTYRTAFALAELLPRSTIHTVDCWDDDGPPAEPAVADVRALERPPAEPPRIVPAKAIRSAIPLPDASCDAVVLGFGTHEIPRGGPREALFEEVERILKPGCPVLMFEHGYDAHNFIIFGPVIGHVTRRGQWTTLLARRFAQVTYARSSAAVDLFAARRHV